MLVCPRVRRRHSGSYIARSLDGSTHPNRQSDRNFMACPSQRPGSTQRGKLVSTGDQNGKHGKTGGILGDALGTGQVRQKFGKPTRAVRFSPARNQTKSITRMDFGGEHRRTPVHRRPRHGPSHRSGEGTTKRSRQAGLGAGNLPPPKLSPETTAVWEISRLRFLIFCTNYRGAL